MKETIKRIGLVTAMIMMAIALMATEYLIADAFGMTINGMTYLEYTKWYIGAHPFVMLFESAITGLMIGDFIFHIF